MCVLDTVGFMPTSVPEQKPVRTIDLRFSTCVYVRCAWVEIVPVQWTEIGGNCGQKYLHRLEYQFVPGCTCESGRYCVKSR